jgi:hypothetical protein
MNKHIYTSIGIKFIGTSNAQQQSEINIDSKCQSAYW